jgi:hypothetical protein
MHELAASDQEADRPRKQHRLIAPSEMPLISAPPARACAIAGNKALTYLCAHNPRPHYLRRGA